MDTPARGRQWGVLMEKAIEMWLLRPRVTVARFIDDKGVWSNHLSLATLWDGQVVPFDRIAGLKNVGARIEESIDLVWRNTSFSVWVTEELCSWVPSFEDDSSESLGSSNSDSVLVGEEAEIEMEEGEFVKPDAEELIAGKEVEQDPVDQLPEVERVGCSSGDGVEVHGDGGINDLHGELNPELITKNNGGIGVTSVAVPNSSLLFSSAIFSEKACSSVGPSSKLGLNQTPLPKKRPRCLRSPQSSESQHGPAGFKPVIMSGEVPDLNAPLRNQAPISSERLCPLDASSEEILNSHSDPELGRGRGPGAINEEVLHTIQVGESIRVELVGYGGMIADAIEGEGGRINFQ
ncbi:hypothetical protein L1987_51428 [Smallanthus sonchifolius]|uniref:Uncharacterized protein n=1 Tax=Smallanthus sonchifolius TaxID=185202 RepID=A0ACB9EQY4_9ASTR|nr:hypothetical protein L1987_51428 [Smallanthus sonchifolius]